MINEDIAQEILHELFSSLEAMETQSAAILQFLEDKGLASEEDLAPYFEQAGNASNVKWRAARVRIDHLLSSAIKAAQETPKSEPSASPKSEQKVPPDKTKGQKADMEASSKKETEKEAQDKGKPVSAGKSDQQQQGTADADLNRSQQEHRSANSEHSAKSDSSEKVPRKKTA